MSRTSDLRPPQPLRRALAGIPALAAAILVCWRIGTLAGPAALQEMPPPAPREFRAAWVATVANIDWPSRPGLPAPAQQRELLAILDRAAGLNLNAIVLQVRPAADALYDSKLEPWSEYLTGKQGRAPEPLYDPLAFAVEEAHRRGLELHAWFNPYRARHPSARGELDARHLARTRPDLVKSYGSMLWMDPGEPEVQERSLSVFLDVVKRYDVDGIHIDDYFYPYKERDPAGNILPFPDDPSWQKYRQSGGALGRDDWRRQNVDRLIERVYRAVKAEKPWVKFGISPFGIPRPGQPPQIKGFDQYAELYADVRKWLVNGWADYFAPQLYWKIEQTPQSYPVLLQWWTEENQQKRHVWVGNYTSRVSESGANAWKPEEIEYQIRTTRGVEGATGNIHFSMKALMQSRNGLSDRLARDVYARPALIPASPWLDSTPPGRPAAKASRNGASLAVSWSAAPGERAAVWLIQWKNGTTWDYTVVPGAQSAFLVRGAEKASLVAVSAVDRCGNQSQPCVLQLRASASGR